MSLPVNVTNQASVYLANMGIVAASGALIGAVTSITIPGGALFGAANYWLGSLVGKVFDRIFNVDNVAVTDTAKAVSKIGAYIFTLIIEVSAMAVAGFPITVGTAVLLGIALRFVTVIPILFGVALYGFLSVVVPDRART